MPLWPSLRTNALAVLFMTASAPSALALTAEEVWADWQRLAKDAGSEISAVTRREGDRLVVTDIGIPVGPPEDQADIRLSRIELQDLPDGSVRVLLPPVFPVTFDLRTPNGDFDLATMTASAPDFSMVVAGVGEKAAVDLSAPSLVLSLEKIVPALNGNEEVDLNLAIADLTIQHNMDLLSPAKTVSTSFRLGTLHGDFFGDVDNTDEVVSSSVDLSNLIGNLSVNLPASIDRLEKIEQNKDLNPLPVILEVLAEGLTVSAEASYGSFSMLADVKRADGQERVRMTSADGQFQSGLDAEEFRYGFAVGKTVLEGRGALPELGYSDLSMGIGEMAYGVSIGIGDLFSAPQAARFTARLIGLTLPAEAMAKLDPSGALGNAPLSFGVEVAARYILGPEMREPGWKPNPVAVPPVDLVDVTLTELMFSGFGVELDGGGALTFDETDLVTFEGFPAPDGKASVRATGVNALIDRLVAAGVIAGDDLTGVRFALAFVAKAGKEPDSLVSEVEFKEKAFYLNGLKIR